MMKFKNNMKAEEIIKIIKDNNLQKLFWPSYTEIEIDDLPEDQDIEDYVANLGIKNFDILEKVCNSDEMYTIVHFKDEDIYLKFTGEYDSYGGGDHYYNDEIKQVFPKQVTITQYLENGL